MAIIGFPYNSLNKDRAIKAEVYRRLLSKYFTTGVFPNPSTQCQVVASSGMNVVVKKGSANINGLYVEIEEDTSVQLNNPDSLDRYDRIVLRSDDSQSVRATKVVVIKGTPSGSPQAPSLTRNETVYDICLATVLVPSIASNIIDSYITDTRLDSGLCGIVSATIESIDTTRFYTQIQDDLDRFRKNEQADFYDWRKEQEQDFVDWFNSLKDYISEEALGEILVTVQQNKEDIEKLQYTGNIVSGETFSGKASNKGIRLHKVVGKSVQNGTPSPDSPVEIENVEISKISSINKNLGNFENGQISQDNGADVNNGNVSRTKNYIYFYNNMITNFKPFRVFMYDRHKLFLGSQVNYDYKIIKDSYLDSAYYIRIQVDKNSIQNGAQIEIGEVSTEYVPHEEATVETSLSLVEGEVYQEGQPFVRKRKKVVFDGSSDEKWSLSSALSGRFVINISDAKSEQKPKCNMAIGSDTLSSDLNKCRIDNNGNFSINTTFNSVEEWKEHIATHPLTVEYELETPKEEEIKVPTIPSYYPNTNVWTDNQVPTDMEWEVLANADNSLEIQDVESNLQNANLLDNADFRYGAINQKGETGYIADSNSNLQYTIDRWGTIKVGSSVGVGADYITVVGSFYQMIDIIKEAQEYMTFAIKRSGNEPLKIVTFNVSEMQSDVDNLIDVDDNIKLGIFFGGGNNKAWVYISTNASVDIDYMKLEVGNKFTGMPTYDLSKEWFNCRRKYKKLKVLAHSISYTDTGYWYNISISDGIPMDKKPSLANYGKSGCVFTWGASLIEDLSISTIEDFDELTNMPLRIGLNKETSMVYPTLEILLELDANDYL